MPGYLRSAQINEWLALGFKVSLNSPLVLK